MRKSLRSGVKGFTLLEVLVAGAISVLVIGAAYMVVQAGRSTLQKDSRKVDLQQNARGALDLLSWQLRLAGYLNLATTPNRVVIGTDTLLVIRGDVQLSGAPGIVDTLFGILQDGTGVCPPRPRPLDPRPCLVTGTNKFTVNPAQVVTAFYISSITFAYFNQNDTPLATPLDGIVAGAFPDDVPAPDPLPGTTTDRDAVRLIRITLTALNQNVGADPGVGSTLEQITLTSDVRFRNIN